MKLVGLIKWNITCFAAVKNLMHVICNALRQFTKVRRISYRSTLFDVVTVRIQHEETVFLA